MQRTSSEQVAVRLPVATVDELRRVAQTNDRTVAAEIRRAIRLYLETVQQNGEAA